MKILLLLSLFTLEGWCQDSDNLPAFPESKQSRKVTIGVSEAMRLLGHHMCSMYNIEVDKTRVDYSKHLGILGDIGELTYPDLKYFLCFVENRLLELTEAERVTLQLLKNITRCIKCSKGREKSQFKQAFIEQSQAMKELQKLVADSTNQINCLQALQQETASMVSSSITQQKFSEYVKKVDPKLLKSIAPDILSSALHHLLPREIPGSQLLIVKPRHRKSRYWR